jgi:hypothetical protein
MENKLKNGRVYKWINEYGDYLYFECPKTKLFVVSFQKCGEPIRIEYGEFDKMLDVANEIIFNHKLQIC